MTFRITELWAWISIGEDGEEGVCAQRVELEGEVCMMPLIGADETRVHQLRPYAEAMQRQSGVPVRLVRFQRTADVEQLGKKH